MPTTTTTTTTTDITESLGDAPTEFAHPPRQEMKHTLTLNIPLPTARAAVQLYHVLRVDKELKPRETFVAYRIDASRTPPSSNVLDIRVSCTTVRQLRLAVNALLDNVTLVVDTMEAFTPVDQSVGQLATKERESTILPDEEFELSGTGRAG